jgi:ornithine lipid ester-linked acyl 2-hydroxylase
VELFQRILFFLLMKMEGLNRRFSLVGDRDFFDETSFPWVKSVAELTPKIQAELAEVLARRDTLPNIQDISPDQRQLSTDAGWKTFYFYGYGLKSDLNCARCPDTTTALQRIPGMVSGYYSILAPGKKLPPHRGPYNGVLRFHLGLKIPASDETCAITVGSRTRSWAEGKALIFDDTYQHEAWNLTPEWRAVLFVDFLRPLPFVPHHLNRLMIWLMTKTSFVQVATKNHANWEKVFYEA